MTRTEKRKFIRELTRNVTADILKRVPDMPENWDGHELRRYVADKFEESVMTIGAVRSPQAPVWRQRLRLYRNDVLIRNL